jgi:hypothetical protein
VRNRVVEVSSWHRGSLFEATQYVRNYALLLAQADTPFDRKPYRRSDELPVVPLLEK